jgi:hypothetical protein
MRKNGTSQINQNWQRVRNPRDIKSVQGPIVEQMPGCQALSSYRPGALSNRANRRMCRASKAHWDGGIFICCDAAPNRPALFRRAVSPKIVRALRTWWESEGAKDTTHFQMELFQMPADVVGNRRGQKTPRIVR